LNHNGGADLGTLVDGVHTPAEYVNSPAGGPVECSDEPLYVTLDLGGLHSIDGVTVWHYYGDTRAYCGQKIAISTTGDFGGEEVVVYDTGSDYGPPETVNGNAFHFTPTTGRYVRHWCARSTANAYVHFLEIDVYGDERVQIPVTDVRLDVGAAVTLGPGVTAANGAATLVDGVHTPAEWSNSPTGGVVDCSESLFVTIDIGAVHNVNGVTLWHYYGDTRAYCGQKLALSATGTFGGEEQVVFNTGEEFGPPEAIDGNSVVFESVAARYVRHWCSRSTANTGVHFLEIDIFGNTDVVVAAPVRLDANATVRAGPGVLNHNGGADLGTLVD
jgi:hypothetical protein